MKKWKELHLSLGWVVLLCVTVAAATALGCFAAFGWRSDAVEDKLREIDRLVSSRYIGEFDEQAVADYAAVGYVTGLGDKWSSYIPADQYAAYQLSSQGKGCGIGVTVISGSESIRVNLVYDDSPAAQAGIEKGEYIVGAEGLTVAADGADAVLDAIAGEAGTEVTVSVADALDGAARELTMERAVVTQKMVWGEMLDDTVGYLRIENFHDGSAEQFQTVLDSLLEQGAQKLVIDVRHNGGGRVKEMSDMLDPLLPAGTIMTLRTKSGSETVYESDEDMIDLPIAVLIDDQSISAAEFFAAALQEYDRATLVGTHTTGKGRAQQTFELSDGSAVNLSVEEYFTPKGNSLADVGIAPDVEVALTDAQAADFYFLAPHDDPQLQKAVETLG